MKYIFTHWRSQSEPLAVHSDTQWFARFIKDICGNVDLKTTTSVDEKIASQIALKWLNNRRAYEFLRRDEKCLEVQEGMSEACRLCSYFILS